MSKIMQGDQYAIPVKIIYGNNVLTPEDVDDVAIKIGTIFKKYSAEEITYNSERQVWEFPITKEQTRAVNTILSYQVGIKEGEKFKYSKTAIINVGTSIITEEW